MSIYSLKKSIKNIQIIFKLVEITTRQNRHRQADTESSTARKPRECGTCISRVKTAR